MAWINTAGGFWEAAKYSSFDGGGSSRSPGEVLVEGDHITRVAQGHGLIACEGATRIDGGGATLMPGLIESQVRRSFASSRARVVRERVPVSRLDLLP